MRLRRPLLATLGLVEVIAALALVSLGVSLPGVDDIRKTFEGARRVTASSGDQVRLLREQVQGLRRARVLRTADQLRDATRTLAASVRRRRADFDAVRALRDVARRSAEGIEGLASVLDPEALGRLGKGL